MKFLGYFSRRISRRGRSRRRPTKKQAEDTYKKAKKAWGYTPAGWTYRQNKRGYNSKFNKKHKVVGLTPDYWVSPFDFTPVGWVSKTNKAYKAGKTGYKLSKKGFSGYGGKAYKNAAKHGASAAASLGNKAGGKFNSKKKSSRRPSSPTRRNSQSRRGGSSRYYWYKGKRYERKYRR